MGRVRRTRSSALHFTLLLRWLPGAATGRRPLPDISRAWQVWLVLAKPLLCMVAICAADRMTAPAQQVERLRGWAKQMRVGTAQQAVVETHPK